MIFHKTLMVDHGGFILYGGSSSEYVYGYIFREYGMLCCSVFFGSAKDCGISQQMSARTCVHYSGIVAWFCLTYVIFLLDIGIG